MSRMKPAQYLTFKLQNLSYGVGIENVREINRMSDIAKVPESPDFVAGVMNLRGKVITVVDLRKRLKMPIAEVTKETCIIVVESEIGHVGIIVDSVQAVIQLAESQIDDSPISDDEGSYVRAIGKMEDHLVMLIDIFRCLSKTEMLGISERQQQAA